MKAFFVEAFKFLERFFEGFFVKVFWVFRKKFLRINFYHFFRVFQNFAFVFFGGF